MSQIVGETPRCGSCGRLMEIQSETEQTIVYECCGRTLVKPGKEFSFVPEQV